MKKLLLLFLLTIPFSVQAQNAEYTVTSYFDEGFKAPNTHYIGEAWLNFLVQSDDEFQYNLTKATFAANSTLDWHKHATAQVIIVVEGEGYYQERGKEPFIMKTGDVITCPQDIEHWHTSTIDSSVTYIAIYGSEPTTWTETLTMEYYNSVAEKLSDSQD